MSIEQLSKATLQQAIFLRDEIFEALSKLDKKTLAASLDPDNFQKFYIQSGIEKLDYWVYITDKNEVVGIVGLYSEYTNQAAWLGWYGGTSIAKRSENRFKTFRFCYRSSKTTRI